jgi:hypothetical protein
VREGLSAKEQLLKKMSPQIHSNEAAATPVGASSGQPTIHLKHHNFLQRLRARLQDHQNRLLKDDEVGALL